MNGQVDGSLTFNFKVIRQDHVIYFNSFFFKFYDLNLVENDTNPIALLHLHQKISRSTNNGETMHFDHGPSWTFVSKTRLHFTFTFYFYFFLNFYFT